MLGFVKNLFKKKREFSNTFMFTKKQASYQNGGSTKFKPMTVDTFLKSDWFRSGSGQISIPLPSMYEDAEERSHQFGYWADLAKEQKLNIGVRGDQVILSKKKIPDKRVIKTEEKVIKTIIYHTEDGKVERKPSNIAAVAEIVKKHKKDKTPKKPSVPSVTEKPNKGKLLSFSFLKRNKDSKAA